MNNSHLIARIEELTAQMKKLCRANGTLPSLASKAGRHHAELELQREVLKHEVDQARRARNLTAA